MMKKFILLLLFSFLIVSGCIGSNKPDWAHQVYWEGDAKEDIEIRALLWEQIEPYRSIEYEIVEINNARKEDAIDIKVTCTSNQSPYKDVYDFSYEDGNLVMTGYLLEALPPADRSKAIMIATSDSAIRQSIADSREGPAVKRILPRTSEKFYQPKTLLSVTWQDAGVSALVDIDLYTVVETWNNGGEN